jgi:hypothetical protein
MRIPGTDIVGVFDVPLTALTDLWEAVNVNQADPKALDIVQRASVQLLAGNTAVMFQQAIAACGSSLGYLPGAAYDAAMAIVGFATGQMSTGEFLLAALNTPLVQLALGKAIEVATAALKEVLSPFADVVTGIPVVGQIVDIIMGLVMGIVQLVKLSKAAEAETNREDEFAPSVPSVEIDRYSAMDVVNIIKTPNWQELFVPLADILDADRAWIRGFSCTALTNGGRRIGAIADRAWGVEGHGYGYLAGTALVSRWIEFGPKGANIWDTGSSMALTRQACEIAYGLVCSDGPAAFAIDAKNARVAWERYISELIGGLETNSICSGKSVKAETMQTVAKWVRSQWGLEGSGDAMVESAPVVSALRTLEKRQTILLRRPVIAYTPVGTAMETQLSEAREELLNSESVCWIDPDAIVDSYYRTRVEIRRANKGALCRANAVNQIGVGGGKPFVGNEEPLPEPETPTPPPPPPPPPPPAKPARKTRQQSSSGAVLLLPLAIGAALLASRR